MHSPVSRVCSSTISTELCGIDLFQSWIDKKTDADTSGLEAPNCPVQVLFAAPQHQDPFGRNLLAFSGTRQASSGTMRKAKSMISGMLPISRFSLVMIFSRKRLIITI
jgi:hypothetical protein